MTEARHIILASGGTGGHIFPARALGEELLARGYVVTLMTDMRGEKYEELFPGVRVLRVASGSPSIRGLLGKVKAAGALLGGFVQSRRLLRRLKPSAVVSFGGYPSMPPAAAAANLGIPLLLHEQNAVLGRVNRLLANRARFIATSFENTESGDGKTIAKMIHTGNPVRRAILALAGKGYSAPRDDGPLNLLILGGSQGATILSDVVPGALAALPESLRARLQVTQQCRPEDLERVAGLYRESAIAATLASFFDNVPELLANCHLAITRSGASTLAELGVAGRPALLVPFKHAMDDHQRKNAEEAVSAGAARLVLQDDFTVEEASRQIADLLSHPDHLAAMAAAMASLGETHAAKKLADLLECTIAADTEIKKTGKAAA